MKDPQSVNQAARELYYKEVQGLVEHLNKDVGAEQPKLYVPDLKFRRGIGEYKDKRFSVAGETLDEEASARTCRRPFRPKTTEKNCGRLPRGGLDRGKLRSDTRSKPRRAEPNILEILFMSEIVFKPIGQIKAQFSDADVRAERKDLEGDLEIYPQFEPALEGIDGYSHLFILAYFDRLRVDQIGPLQVKPRRLVNRGFKLDELPLLGVLALDSPTRPNPIGLTLVRLLRRQGRFLKVSGLDYFDGTPIIDIKGYRPSYRADEFSVPDWHKKLQDARGHI